MADFDAFASNLLEEAKRFLEKAKEADSEAGKTAYLHAAVIVGFSAFEAHLNAIADEFCATKNLTLHEQALLLEKEVALNKGVFKLTDSLKMYRTIDRLHFLYQRFGRTKWEDNPLWMNGLLTAMKTRNELMHPKVETKLSIKDVQQAILAIVEALDALYQSLYRKGFPAAKRGADSKLVF